MAKLYNEVFIGKAETSIHLASHVILVFPTKDNMGIILALNISKSKTTSVNIHTVGIDILQQQIILWSKNCKTQKTEINTELSHFVDIDFLIIDFATNKEKLQK